MSSSTPSVEAGRSRGGAAASCPSAGVAPRRRDQAEAQMLAALPTFERPSPTFLEQLTLPALLLTAWIVFELTANATLTLLAACLKFGWEDFRTAGWLKRVDPNLGRGRTCCWFYAASGIWKTSLMPIVVVMIASLAVALLSPRAFLENEAVATQTWSAIVVGLAASTLLVLVTMVAAALAVAHGVRVWVHHDLHDSRRHDAWPPRWRSPVWQHENFGRAVLATALLFATIGLPPLLFRAIILLGQRMEIAAALLVVFGIPMAATTAYAFLRGRIFAGHPWQCWPESGIDATLVDE